MDWGVKSAVRGAGPATLGFEFCLRTCEVDVFDVDAGFKYDVAEWERLAFWIQSCEEFDVEVEFVPCRCCTDVAPVRTFAFDGPVLISGGPIQLVALVPILAVAVSLDDKSFRPTFVSATTMTSPVPS